MPNCNCTRMGFTWAKCPLVVCVVLSALPNSVVQGQQDLVAQAQRGLKQAAEFFHQQVAVEGGYVYMVSADLKFREGEGVVDAKTVWVQPPGTPAVGMALIEAYERTGKDYLLAAAKDAGMCLVKGQLHSGGWQAQIDFGSELRPKQAYRVDGPRKKKARNLSTFDDDKTQSAIRFLAKLDKAMKFNDPVIHEANLFALESMLKNQFPNGGWGQVYEVLEDREKYAVMKASYPDNWPREYPGGDYWWYYTLNDHNMTRNIQTLFVAAEIYGDPRYRESAMRGADFLLLAQMPEPQPAWAQQYDFNMHPVWARKFEPPAVSGSESQGVIGVLMEVYEQTGNRKYLEPIPRALDYLKKNELPNGEMARFYELQTNKPLFLTKDYKLTYTPDDLPTHYGFIGSSSVAQLRKRFDELSRLSPEALRDRVSKRAASKATEKPGDETIRRILGSLDQRGAWVENGSLRYHKGEARQVTKQIISSQTFIRNINALSSFLADRSK